MTSNKKTFILLGFLMLLIAGCSTPAVQPTLPAPSLTPEIPTAIPTNTLLPTNTITPIPTETLVPSATPFEVGRELTMEYLLGMEIPGSEITIEEQINDRSNYHQYIASYISEGNKIYGLLTIPFEEPPEGGYKAVVFCHGYIPPSVYQTRERYEAYADYLARRGLVVFKIDYRGHGQSEGEPSGFVFLSGLYYRCPERLQKPANLRQYRPERDWDVGPQHGW